MSRNIANLKSSVKGLLISSVYHIYLSIYSILCHFLIPNHYFFLCIHRFCGISLPFISLSFPSIHLPLLPYGVYVSTCFGLYEVFSLCTWPCHMNCFVFHHYLPNSLIAYMFPSGYVCKLSPEIHFWRNGFLHMI